MSLFKEEIARAKSREVVRFVAAAGIVGVLLGCLIAGAGSRPPTTSDWAAAREARLAAQQACLTQSSHGDSPSCDPGEDSLWLSPKVKVYDVRSVPDAIALASTLFALAAWLIGAVLVGGDWASGTMSTLLTWEPRRIRLLAAKLASAGVVVLVLAGIVLTILVLGLTSVSTLRGLHEAPAGFWPSVIAMSVRTILLTSVFAMMAGATAFFSRSAAFSMASLASYLLVVEGLARLRVPLATRWLIVDNAIAWVVGRPSGSDGPLLNTLSNFRVQAIVILGAWLVACMLLASWSFRSRDVS
jgi:ABC-2 type transport system permease protein